MAVLNIRWETADRVGLAKAEITPTEGEGDTAAVEESKPTLEKPLIVYVVAEGDAEAIEKIDKVALDPDKVRVGSNYFRCVKMTPENAAADPLISEAGKDTPRLVFVDTSYEVVEVLEAKKVSGSKIYSAMQKTARASFEGNFDRNVKSLIKVLGEFDKIADERSVLEEKEKRGVNAAQAKKIAKEKEELDERQKKAEEEKSSLLSLEKKSLA